MQQKIFIGIQLDPYIQKKLAKSIEQWQELPIKWYKEHNLSIALFSFGWIGEEDVTEISSALAEVGAKTTTFTITFDQILAFAKDPEKTNIRDAQSIRLVGHESRELRDLYQNIAHALDLPVGAKQSFKPYVDLGKIRIHQWQELKTYPKISTEFSAAMDVYAVTIFENTHVDGKRQFVPIDVHELG